MSVNSEMTAIADLIRGLRGVSGKMGLDAMKGHLQDEQDGLDSALAALTEKGVTVPDGTKVDGLAALIAAIETGSSGGGLPNGVSALDGGTFTLASDSSPSGLYAIQHSMGKVPNFFIVAMKGTVGTDCAGYLVLSDCVRMSFANSADVIGKIHSIANGGGMVTSDMTYRGMASTMFTDNNFSLFLNNRPFKAGVEYAWVCGVIDGLV